MRVRWLVCFFGFVLLVAALGCRSGGQAATQGAGDGSASANADRVLVATLAPEPTRTPEPPTLTAPTSTQAPAATVALPAVTPAPPTPTSLPPTATATPSPTPTATPSPTVTPFASSSLSATPTTASTPPTLSDREQAIYAAHQAERASRGIAYLTVDPALQTIARARAQTMADNHLFSHYNPNGDTIYDMFADADYDWTDATENIHFNDVSLSQSEAWAMTEYMASPPHRANILKPGFHRVGIGVATSTSGVHYYSVVFSD